MFGVAGLRLITQLTRHTRERSAPDSQADIRVRTSVLEPRVALTTYRDEVSLLTATYRPNGSLARLSGLSTGRC
jgi:hypothetical protein